MELSAVEPTLGDRLIVLKDRSGLSLAKIAERAGYQGASSIQKLFRPDYNPPGLQVSVAQKLAGALTGMGNPRIEEWEIRALIKIGNTDRVNKALADMAHYSHLSSKWIVVRNTQRIGSCLTTENGLQTPLFISLDPREDVPIFSAPEHLHPKSVSAIYVTVGNMWPRFEEGEMVFIDHRSPAERGDDVVLTVVDENNIDGASIIGRLYLMHDDEVQIDQLSQPGRVIVPRNSVISVRRILSRADMLPPLQYAKSV